MKQFRPDRRRFLKLGAGLAGSSLVLGINWSCSSGDPIKTDSDSFSPNAWLRIDEKGVVTVIVAESEMGQGPFTGLPMMLAEELDAKWQDIRVERAPLKAVYGYQMTGGSRSIRRGWTSMRQAGAIAKEILRQAAAQTWQVPLSECHAKQSKVFHTVTKRSLSYTELVSLAKTLPIPETALLKEADEFEIIGTPLPRLDSADKINGRARFGIDVRLPGMRYATITHCPVFGGKAKRVDAAAALQIDGVLDVFSIDRGVVVLAQDTWSAFKGRAALNIEWDFAGNEGISNDSIIDRLAALEADDQTKILNQGETEQLLDSKSISSRYILPFQAHVPLEPMNCTASYEGGKLRIWAPTQSPSEAYDAAKEATQSQLTRVVNKITKKLTGGEDDSIEINTTLLGGGFGRRLKQDFVTEAAQIAQHTNQPIQLIWTRDEDIQHDFYHPLTMHEMRGALDEQGLPLAWHHTIKGPNVKSRGAKQLPYDIPNIRVDLIDIGKVVPVGPWRSVQHAYNAFAVEHFFDELAASGKHDPLQLRLQLMGSEPRLKKTLEIAAEKAEWSYESKLFGCASHMAFGSYTSEIVQLEEDAGGLRIAKITCVVDCGIAVNPDQVRAQMEGSIVFALTAALKSSINIKQGRTEQSNFHDYPIIKMSETPPIEIFIVASGDDPGGVGEPGVPPMAPALANALLAALGKPVRSLPLAFENGHIKI